MLVTLFYEAGIEDDVTESSEDDGRRRHHRALEDESSDGEDESSSSGDENNAISKVTFLDVCENNFEDAPLFSSKVVCLGRRNNVSPCFRRLMWTQWMIKPMVKSWRSSMLVPS